MNKKYRVGIIGFAHMHINELSELFAKDPRIEIAACANTESLEGEPNSTPYTRGWNFNNVTAKFKTVKIYDDYHKMLTNEKLDIAIITTEVCMHPEVVVMCAKIGVNVIVEKPMSMTYSDALLMYRACEEYGVKMVVNWPVTWNPALRKAKELIDAGEIGKIAQIRHRASHYGPLGTGVSHKGVSETAVPLSGKEKAKTWWHQTAKGGGAMLDFCSYGVLLSRWFLGEQAVSAVGMRANIDSHWSNAEDNAVMIIRYPKAIGICEASWTTVHSGVESGPIIFGTQGTMVVGEQNGTSYIRVEKGNGCTDTYQAGDLPEGRRNVAQEMIHHLETGEAVHTTINDLFNLDVSAIIDAGIRSTFSGKIETVASPSWQIG